MKVKRPKLLIISILISQLAGVIGSAATGPAIATWYVDLNKPSFNPPSWIFAPVWLTLYTLMGISFYLVLLKREDKKGASFAVKVFLLHLAVNSLWSIVFFGLKQIALAFFVIFALWLLIVYLIKLFKNINKWSAYLLLPYLAWVSFAAILNFFLWMLNPQ
jgi:tryptophan-rich sensory protein